jgi:hypothetical protein
VKLLQALPCVFGAAEEKTLKSRRHLQHDWLPVVGQLVEIRRGDQVVREGIVDGVTTDGGILWLAADGAQPRSMFERSEGFSVWIEYKWESVSANQ